MNFELFEPLYRSVMQANGLERFCGLRETDLFRRFLDLFFVENEKTNLSAIRTLPEAVAKHVADCLLAADKLPQGAAVLDLGCGGGFPTFPLAIARPDLCITAMDSTGKKVEFVAKTAKTLGLGRVKTICGRAEDPKWVGMRETFDVVTGRAVANLRVFAELAFPFARVGGTVLSYKGSQGSAELKEAENAIRTLGGAVTEDRVCNLFCPIPARVTGQKKESAENTAKSNGKGAENNGKSAESNVRPTEKPGFTAEGRHLILLRKERPTPKQYPRAYAAILKKPL